MTIIDFCFMALLVLILVLMLVQSKMMRVIVLESLRHPFQASHIEVREGKVFVTRQAPSRKEESQPQSPAGVR